MYWAEFIMIILHTYHILCCHYNNYLRNNANIIHDTIRQPPKLSLVLPWSSKGRQWLINLTILHLAIANTRQWLNYLIISDLFRHPHHTILHEWGSDHSHQADNTWEQLASKYPPKLHWWGDLGLTSLWSMPAKYERDSQSAPLPSLSIFISHILRNSLPGFSWQIMH